MLKILLFFKKVIIIKILLIKDLNVKPFIIILLNNKLKDLLINKKLLSKFYKDFI